MAERPRLDRRADRRRHRRARRARRRRALDSRLLLALAYTGFFLNLFNLIPIGFLDGGFILRSLRVLRRGAGDPDPARARRHAWLLACMYAAVAALLVARDDRRARPAGPSVTADERQLDRRLLRRTHETLAGDVSLIAAEFLAGFQAVERIDRPAVSIFGSARVREGTPYVRGRPDDGGRASRRQASPSSPAAGPA